MGTKQDLNFLTKYSASYILAQQMKPKMLGEIFHQHYHILFDIINYINKDKINYVEIGVHYGGSMCLVLQNPKIENLIGIDTFSFPNQNEYLEYNLKKFNPHGKSVNLIQKNSTDPQTSDFIKDIIDQIDLLYIDGSNIYKDIISDFEIYSKLVEPGGYIVIDDYHDSIYCPQVKPAVDEIVKRINDGFYKQAFEIIGCLDNHTKEITTAGKPETYGFIIRKAEKSTNSTTDLSIDTTKYEIDNIQFAIVIATYNRPDGSTPAKLKNCLQNVQNQRYTNWIVYLVGDDYENEEEFKSFINLIDDPAKIKIHNKSDPERKHISDKKLLWNIAGASSMNYGLNWSRRDNIKLYTHLDDDDAWDNNHLSDLAAVYLRYPHCVFAYTRSTYINGRILPREDIYDILPNNLLPRGGNLIHSSVSFRSDVIPFDYFTTHKQEEIYGPSDAIMWDKINFFLSENVSYCGVYVPHISCFHDEEGSAKR